MEVVVRERGFPQACQACQMEPLVPIGKRGGQLASWFFSGRLQGGNLGRWLGEKHR